MYKVLVPEALNPVAKKFLEDRNYDLVIPQGTDPESLKKAISEVDAVIARTEKYTPDVIRAGKNLKIIARYGIGYDNIDLATADEQGITVTLARNCNIYSVAEQTITLMLCCLKQVVPLYQALKEGNWKSRDVIPTYEARNKTIGILGIGAIGFEVAKIAHFGFQMKVLAYDNYADRKKYPEWITFVDRLEDFLPQADVASIHVPLTKDTHHMLNRKTISCMKPTAVLLNAARGPIWNESDLYVMLKEHRIAAAGTDVFETEPPSPDTPLFSLPNFIGCPHTAALSKEAIQAVAMNCVHAIDDLLHGKQPLYIINHPQKLDD